MGVWVCVGVCVWVCVWVCGCVHVSLSLTGPINRSFGQRATTRTQPCALAAPWTGSTTTAPQACLPCASGARRPHATPVAPTSPGTALCTTTCSARPAHSAPRPSSSLGTVQSLWTPCARVGTGIYEPQACGDAGWHQLDARRVRDTVTATVMRENPVRVNSIKAKGECRLATTHRIIELR